MIQPLLDKSTVLKMKVEQSESQRLARRARNAEQASTRTGLFALSLQTMHSMLALVLQKTSHYNWGLPHSDATVKKHPVSDLTVTRQAWC